MDNVMELFLDPQAWAAFITLTLLEIVLGIDNIIFITILVGRVPASQRPRARTVGLALAMLTRIALLLSIVWVMRLTTPLFTVLGEAVSLRDLVLIAGGGFLLAKSTMEIHASLEGGVEEQRRAVGAATFALVVVQIMVLDIVFSLDSVITAVGLARDVPVMVAAIVAAVAVMMWAAGPVGDFVDRHPTIKMLALSFLILIGVSLFAEGLGFHIPKGYIYFAMAFSVAVEALNMRVRRRRGEPVKLRKTLADETVE